MIPKIVHYCWFGGKPLPEVFVKYIASWHKYLPDYEFKLWNEDNFDVSSVDFTKEAYSACKYAFVCDYVRVWALYNYGGVYLDVDVEMLKPLDDLMALSGFIGFEAASTPHIGTGLIGCQPYGEWIAEVMDYYLGRHFIREDGSLDMIPNTDAICRMMVSNGLDVTGGKTSYKDMEVFPSDYFSPLTSTRVLNVTGNTYCIHHYAESWRDLTLSDKVKDFIVYRLLGVKLTDRLVRLKRKLR